MSSEIGGFQFAILGVDSPRDLDVWVDLLDESPSAEVFAHPAYLQLFEDESTKAMCAVGQLGDSRVIYPFMMRKIDAGSASLGIDELSFDLITPYGYGGPFTWGDSAQNEFAEIFWARFGQWARDSSVVTAFVRQSLFEDDLLAHDGNLEIRQVNVVRDLAPSDEHLWMDFEKKVRKNVRRAVNSGVEVEIDSSGDRLGDFLAIYRQTMDRRQADDGYYFSDAFFESIVRELEGRFVFFHAMHEQRVVSTELVLLSRHSVYSFLGGTNSDNFHLRPNDLLKFEIIKWAKRSGYAQFVLGGGAAESDGIFRYKRSFAPSGMRSFKTVAKVFDEEALQRLVKSRSVANPGWLPSPGFFPPYRS